MKSLDLTQFIAVLFALSLVSVIHGAETKKNRKEALAYKTGVKAPVIVGDWWQVAGNPMDHQYATEKQEPVDFAVWQAADGTWQIWSCLRRTSAGGKKGAHRVFYRWEGKKLTDANWKPMGIAMDADPKYGETPGGLQAPHVVKVGDTYHMFYGDWRHICHATSKDGKTFERVIQPNGKTGMFEEAPWASDAGVLVNTRDIMMLDVDGLWHGYYTARVAGQGAVFCRTTRDFKTWSPSEVVALGGQSGTGPGSSECPHVVRLDDDNYYLFKTQTYGPYRRNLDEIRKRGEPRTSVYHSSDPMKFGFNQDDRHLVCRLPVAAPEIIHHEGKYYIAALNTGMLNGIRMARLEFRDE
ncbi:MAG: hypothetical protein JW818_05345 [Pirellulales bacterium]|nr:hypothetical protein [Pirellulales bacterium]